MFAALGRTVSLAEVLADLRRHDAALIVASEEAPSHVGEVPRIVLVADRAERAELERVLGRERLSDGLSWFEQWRAREAFEQQPKVELDLDPSRVLVAVPVQDKAMQGQIGLPRALPGAPSAQILACRRRRRVCSADVPEAQASFVGVLQSDSFCVDRQFQSLSERDMVRIAAACRNARPELAKALANAWSSFDAFELTLGRAWGRLLLQLLVDGRGRKALSDQGPRALADLPLFEHADGSFWTLDAIVSQHESDEDVYLHREGTAFEGTFPKLTLLERPYVASVLEPIIGEPKDLAEATALRRARDYNRNVSPDMPTPPHYAVEIGDVSGRGLEGFLWIDVRLDDGAVALGDEERVAGFTTVRRCSSWGAPCGGQRCRSTAPGRSHPSRSEPSSSCASERRNSTLPYTSGSIPSRRSGTRAGLATNGCCGRCCCAWLPSGAQGGSRTVRRRVGSTRRCRSSRCSSFRTDAP